MLSAAHCSYNDGGINWHLQYSNYIAEMFPEMPVMANQINAEDTLCSTADDVASIHYT